MKRILIGLAALGLLAGCSHGLTMPVDTPAATHFVYSDGTYQIGEQIPVGSYSTQDEQPCLVSIDGYKATPTTRITLTSSERSFALSGGCTWTADTRP